MAFSHPRLIGVGQQVVRADHFPPWSILWSLGLLDCPTGWHKRSPRLHCECHPGPLDSPQADW